MSNEKNVYDEYDRERDEEWESTIMKRVKLTPDIADRMNRDPEFRRKTIAWIKAETAKNLQRKIDVAMRNQLLGR